MKTENENRSGKGPEKVLMPKLRPGEVYGKWLDLKLPDDPAGFLAESPLEDLRVCLDGLTDICHGASLRAGWWHDGDGLPHDLPHNVPVKLCLIHSEISEAMEADRKGLADDKLTYRPGIEVELADALIRIFDLAGAMGLDLPGATIDKLRFNAGRADHKPENRAAPGGKAY